MADQRREPRERPSPDALLAMANRQDGRAGCLKIFLGAAPGVGKTYEMLQEARSRLKDGKDVVAAIVETHGRTETEALLEGLEVLPRQRLKYKGRWLEEMDLDALLARQPGLALVRTSYRVNDDGRADVDAVNAALFCRDHLLGSLDDRSTRIVKALLDNQTKKDIAASEGISPSAVSQRASRDGLDLIVLASEYLGKVP